MHAQRSKKHVAFTVRVYGTGGRIKAGFVSAESWKPPCPWLFLFSALFFIWDNLRRKRCSHTARLPLILKVLILCVREQMILRVRENELGFIFSFLDRNKYGNCCFKLIIFILYNIRIYLFLVCCNCDCNCIQ